MFNTSDVKDNGAAWRPFSAWSQDS